MNPTDALGPELQRQPSGPSLEDALRDRLDALNNRWNQWVLGYNPARQRALLWRWPHWSVARRRVGWHWWSAQGLMHLLRLPGPGPRAARLAAGARPARVPRR